MELWRVSFGGDVSVVSPFFVFLCSWFIMLMVKIDNPYRRLGCCACYMFFLVRLFAAPAQRFVIFLFRVFLLHVAFS